MTMKSSLIGKPVLTSNGEAGRIKNIFSHGDASRYTVQMSDGHLRDMKPGEFRVVRKRVYRETVRAAAQKKPK